MRRFLFTGLALLMTTAISELSAEDREADALRLTLPPTGYAVVGEKMTVYLDNIILVEQQNGLGLQVNGNLGGTVDGNQGAKFWTFTPGESDVGVRRCEFTVTRGDMVAKKSMEWRISPAKVQVDRPMSLLIIGDSLTHATVYPNELARRLAASGISELKLLGTHRPANAATGVAHEGYGGWRWQTFVEHFEPNPDPDKTKRKHSSPFVFLQDGKPQLNVARYIQEFCGNSPPDFVIFKLGINDCFGADPSEIAMTDVTIDAVFRHAETLLAAFRQAAPHAELGICLTTPGNSRDAAFDNNYSGKYPRWGWKRIQHRLVERQLQHFLGREKEKIHVIPTELNLDPIDGYPADNGVHPNEHGYHQIAASIHAWLMSRLNPMPR